MVSLSKDLMMADFKNKWLILIEEKEVVSCLVDKESNFFVSKHREWNGNEKDDLLATLDATFGECLSSSEQDHGPGEAIFILSPFWVSPEGEVLETRKQILKEICQSSKISPLGFLIGEEVLGQKFESFISVYFSQGHFRVSLVGSGEIKSKEQVEGGLGMELKDLALILERVKGDHSLPKKLIFWGIIDQDSEKKLTSHNWRKERVFKEPPEIEVVSWEKLFRLFVGVISDQAISEGEEVIADSQSAREERPSFDKTTVEEKLAEKEPGLGFGFVDTDVAQPENDGVEPKKIVKEEEVKEILPPIEVSDQTKIEEVLPEGKKIVDLSEPAMVKKPEPRRQRKVLLPPFFLKGVKAFFFKKRVALVPVVIFLLLALTWNFSKVKLEIYVTAEDVSKEIEVQMSPLVSQLDAEKKIIPIESLEVVVKGEKSSSATGQKLIGERAKGKLTIYNRTPERKTFPPGTVLIGPGSLKFVLDNEVQVASKTPDLASGVDRWGETEAAVIAKEIGAEYNLAAQSVFSITSFSEDKFLAKNHESITGGNSRQIRAVSKEDQDNLGGLLTEELKSKAEKELAVKASGGKILEKSLRTEVVSEKYNTSIGDEKDNLSLKLELKVSVAKLSEDNLVKIAEEIMKKDLTEDLVLNKDTLSVDAEVDRVEGNGVVVGKLIIKGKAYPAIDSNKIAERLKFKRRSEVQKITKDYPRIYRYQLTFQPSFFGVFNLLPPQAKNISVELKE